MGASGSKALPNLLLNAFARFSNEDAVCVIGFSEIYANTFEFTLGARKVFFFTSFQVLQSSSTPIYSFCAGK